VTSEGSHGAVVHLDDAADPRLADYTALTDVALRRRLEPAGGLYMAESTQVVRRALAAGHRPRSLLLAPRWLDDAADVVAAVRAAGADVLVAPEPLLASITGFHLHRGAIAAMHRPALPAVADLLDAVRPGRPGRGRRLLVLEDVVDHTNVGAAFRSAAALGADALLVSPRCADPLYRRSVRVSMGTVLQVPWTRLEPWPGGLRALAERGYLVAALALADDAVPLDDLERRVLADPGLSLALVLGTEGAGLAAGTLAASDVRVRIPMAGGVDSLNVAAAAAVAVHALRPR
jgi:tRNA G18 (ribose-2'-O)-methylase SpoU